jgi:hypothetical protein
MLGYLRKVFADHGFWLPIQELVFLVALLFIANNFIVRDGQVIHSDGKGYYDYLPATFIYKDLNFNFTDTLQTRYYNHREDSKVYIQEVQGSRVNKYFVGTAVMQLPFFLGAHAIALVTHPEQADGYSDYYQKAIYFAALFYVLVGLYFIRLTLIKLGVRKIWIFVLQVAILFASSLVHYVISDPAFSHVYSFALVSMFSYIIVSQGFQKPSHLLWLALLLGLIILVRPVNAILVIFIPFLMLISKQDTKSMLRLFSNKKMIFLSLLIFSGVLAIQPWIWYIQTGQLWVSSYGEESFDFLNSHLFDFLFSYRKGFFVYAPMWLFLLLIGSILAVNNKEYRLVLAFNGAFIGLVFVLSSWWYWSYGASFGSRVMIDLYPILALMGVPFFNNRSTLLKLLAVPVFLIFGALSLVQTYQYKKYILTWDDMNSEGYWHVFLKMDKKYEGLLWQIPWREDWSSKLLFEVSDLPMEGLQKEMKWFDFQVDSTYSKIAVLIEGQCGYDLGTTQFVVEIQNAAHELQFYHEQYVFKATGKENYDGPILLAYYINSLAPGLYHLKIGVDLNDETVCPSGVGVAVHGMK